MDYELTDQERDVDSHLGHGVVREMWYSPLPCADHPHGGCPITVLTCEACGTRGAYHGNGVRLPLPSVLHLPARAGAA
ncbi:MAG: hypothetical protein ACYDB6_02930 [Candidatus Limnocylindrales bacterium]